jgi:hypothetical protein
MKKCRWLLLACLLLVTMNVYTTNIIQAENLKLGTTEWKLTNSALLTQAIEGYPSMQSVNAGGQIQFLINTKDPNVAIDVFRMGWYQGLGGRRMQPSVVVAGVAQPDCPMDTFGLIECHWTTTYTLNIPADWVSGYYLVKLTGLPSGKQQYLKKFVVRDDLRFSDLLEFMAVNTEAAYNTWGSHNNGKSLYGTTASPGDTANKAMKVSFNRPDYGATDNTAGAADFFQWDFPAVQWLEREGYDVTYATDIDMDARLESLLNHKAILINGHSEYWTMGMRNNLSAAINAGVNVGVFAGNICYWQVRYEPSQVNGDDRRTVVGYKEFWRNDPTPDPKLTTTRWRDAPVSMPEDSLFGVMYITQARPPFVVEDGSSWVLNSTGLKNGDAVKNIDGTSFMGYEIDTMGPSSPANTQRIAHSPARPSSAYFADTTMYRASSGATVFATGSIAWSWTIPAIQQMTRNILARLISNSFADTTPIRPPLPSPFQSKDIGGVGRPGFVSQASNSSLTLNGAGQDAFNGSDALFYAYQTLTGDGEITARLLTLQNYWDNRAGIMIRETLSPTAKYVALMGRPSESTGTINEGAEFWVKSTDGAKRQILNTKDQAMTDKSGNVLGLWLKLARSGNVFTSFVSSDGTSWVQVGSTALVLTPTIYIGAEVQSAQNKVWATAKFDNVRVSAITSVPTTCQDPNANNFGGLLPCTYPPPPTSGGALDRSDWKAISSEADYQEDPAKALDGNIQTRFSTGSAQHPTQTFQVSWTGDRSIGRIRMDLGSSAGDYPRICAMVLTGSTGSTNVPCVADATGNIDVTFTSFAVQKIVVTQSGTAGNWWSIAEFNAYSPSGVTPPTPTPPTASFTANPASIQTGQTTTLSWSTTNASSITLNNGIGTVALNGSVNVSPTNTTSYTLTATGSGGTVTKTTTVSVALIPPSDTCAVTPSKTSYYSGAFASSWPVTFTVSSSSCTWTISADASWIVVPTPGTFTGSVTAKIKTQNNTTGAKRQGHLNIAGTIYLVTQDP